MITVRCCAVVHGEAGVVLVKDRATKWRLPEVTLDGTVDPLTSMRDCVKAQTGLSAAKLRLFRVITRQRTPKQGAFVNFVFGCEVEGQQTTDTAAFFSPEAIIKLAGKGAFKDQIVLRLVDDYRENSFAAEDRSPMP